MSCHPKLGCPPQNDHPNPTPQPEGPAPAPPAAELQPDNQPPPVQPALNPSEPSNPTPHQVQPHGDLTNPMPQPEGPAPAPPATELHPDNQPPPVQPALNSSDPSNPAPHQLHGGCPPPNQFANPMPQQEGIELVSLATEFKNQPPPVQTVMNPSGPINAVQYQINPYGGYPVQCYLPNPMSKPEAPAPAPPAELQPVNQPAPVQPVVNPSGPSNPAPQQGQPYAGSPVQNNLPNLMPHVPAPAAPAELQSVNQPAPVQPVMNPSGPINPTPHQGQLYAGKHRLKG
ncbi:hypothetical protein ABG768_024913 [Culter alburnus]|uniref:Uncharacterized protein n=1 Tax=Culter alburnus TaxID=194366 RepID=A0AAW2AD22_CULAL